MNYKKASLVFSLMLIFVLVVGCAHHSKAVDITEKEVYLSDDGDCDVITGYQRFSGYRIPFNITIDDEKVINLSDFSTSGENIFNFSDRVKKASDGLIEIYLFDTNYLKIGLMSADDYTNCKVSTIERLIELNATDILYDICVHYPRIAEVVIKGNFREGEHKVKVCW